MTNKVLQINNLSKNYRNIKALDELSLSVNKGNIFGILGPNGSGKTTTLAIILGIVKANSGTFSWFEEDENFLINYKIGALLETPNFYPYLSIYNNLQISGEIKRISNIEQEIDRVLELTDLAQRKHSKFNTLSFGMKQRLAISSLLMGDPEVLVLDEPTNGLDPEGIADIRNIILSEAKKGKTIIFASHILDEVEKICSHVAILKKGKIITVGQVSEILGNEEKIIISAENINLLYNYLSESEMVKEISIEKNDIVLILKDEYSGSDINKFAFEKNIILSKFEIRKKSLESQFLEIIK